METVLGTKKKKYQSTLVLVRNENINLQLRLSTLWEIAILVFASLCLHFLAALSLFIGKLITRKMFSCSVNPQLFQCLMETIITQLQIVLILQGNILSFLYETESRVWNRYHAVRTVTQQH